MPSERVSQAVGAVPALRLRSLSKTFPGTRALSSVDLDLWSGEVHALVGHNGSGKSTLIKVLAGYHHPDEEVPAVASVDGDPLDLYQSDSEQHRRLRFVHQGLGLIDALTGVENVALGTGYHQKRLGRIDWARQIDKAHLLLQRFGVDFDVNRSVSDCTEVQRTGIAIARALNGWEERGARVLVLDEPTAALAVHEVQSLFRIINEVTSAGIAVLYVTHRLGEVFEIADRATVLRGGQVVGSKPVAKLDRRTLVSLMIGHEAADFTPPPPRSEDAQPVLQAKGLTGEILDNVSFTAFEGEILGIAGLVGSGREELSFLLAGAQVRKAGMTSLDGHDISDVSPGTMVDVGIGFVPPDRGRQGAVTEFTVRENATLALLKDVAPRSRLNHVMDRSIAQTWIDKLDVHPARTEAEFTHLSGGNQQKVIVGRWLSTRPRLLILDEPTLGVDVGAREKIYEVIKAQVADGLTVIVCSSDNAELADICHRVLVLSHGHVISEVVGDRITEQELVYEMTGFQMHESTDTPNARSTA